MILSAMFGAATLMAAISVRASLLPTVSIMCAALRVRSRTISIVDTSLGDPVLDIRVVTDGLPEGDAGGCALAHQFQCALGHSDCTHAVVDAAGAEAGLADRESFTLTGENVLGRDAHVLESDLAVSFAVLVAENRQVAQDRGRRGASIGTNHHRLLTVGGGIEVGLAHDDQKPCSSGARRWKRTTYGRSARTRRRHGPYGAGMLVASELATSGSVIAKAERISPFEKRLEVLLLVLVGAEEREHLHVSRVRSGAVGGLGRPGGCGP